jgi:glycosyltransferase involved in cell wall biosynthesis
MKKKSSATVPDKIAVYIPSQFGGVQNVTKSLADSLERRGITIERCSTLLDLLTCRCKGVKRSILSLESGLVAPFFSKSVFIVHGLPMHPYHSTVRFKLINLMLLYVISAGAVTVAVSDFVRVIYHRLFNVKIAMTISNGVGDEYFKVESSVPKQKQILFAGRFEESKGVRNIVTAFQQSGLSESGYNLLFIGKGSLESYLKKVSEMDPSVTIRHNVSEKEKVLIFRASEIFISLHDLEPMGVVFAEALASKCKIVCPNTGGHLGFIPYGYPAITVDPNAIGEVKKAMQFAVTNLGQPEFDAKKFSYDWIASEYLRALEYA